MNAPKRDWLACLLGYTVTGAVWLWLATVLFIAMGKLVFVAACAWAIVRAVFGQ